MSAPQAPREPGNHDPAALGAHVRAPAAFAPQRRARLPACRLFAALPLAVLLAGAGRPPDAEIAQRPGAAPPALMPMPAHLTWGQGVLALGRPVFTWEHPPSPLLRRAAMRFTRRLARLAPLPDDAPALSITIAAGRDPDWLTTRMREHYRLQVTPRGARLTADGPAGVLRGLATLLQLVTGPAGGRVLATAEIDDSPRFAWRGVMLDASRHFASVETVERQIDAMELVKLDVLHWHLSDGTGFRIQSLRYPKLQRIAGHGQYYTQDQIRAVVAYAADRGVRVVPEIDVPGHTLDLLQAYPALAAQRPVPFTPGWTAPCGRPSARHDGAKDAESGEEITVCARRFNENLAALDPIAPRTLAFLRGLLGEMTHLFPDRYFHTGGDEVQAAQWMTNPRIAAFIRAHGIDGAPGLQALFTAKVEKILRDDGKIMMGWDEVSEAPIPKSVVVEVWRNPKWTGLATAEGHPVVVAAGYYLDLLQSSARHYAVDPAATRPPGLDAAQIASLRARRAAGQGGAFVTDPDAPPLTAAQRALVMGGEAPLWSEIVTDQMTDARLWPRAAAIAERFWSPADVTDIAAMYARLQPVSDELETLGLRARAHESAMIDRFTPADTTPVARLVEATAPVSDYALNHLETLYGDQVLAGPAAIAAPDSWAAIDFNARALRYARQERAGAADAPLAAALTARLMRYAALDTAWARVTPSAGRERARPAAEALAELARLGLEALAPGPHPAAWRARACAALQARELPATDGSDSPATAMAARPLAQSGLVIAILPGLRALIDAAR